MKNAISWFEIPVADFERGKKFYETVLDAKMQDFDMGSPEHKMAFFPSEVEADAVGGAIMSGPGYEPSEKGALVYLNAGEDLADALSRVENAGGKIYMPKTAIGDGEHGYMALFQDSEGNRVAFHSNK